MACLHCRRSERCNRSWMSLILTGMSEGWTSVKEPTQFNGLVTSLTLPLFTECESLLLLSEPDMILFRFPGFLTHAGLKGYWRPSNVLGAAVWPGNNLTKENAHTISLMTWPSSPHATRHVKYIPDFLGIFETMNHSRVTQTTFNIRTNWKCKDEFYWYSRQGLGPPPTVCFF